MPAGDEHDPGATSPANPGEESPRAIEPKPDGVRINPGFGTDAPAGEFLDPARRPDQLDPGDPRRRDDPFAPPAEPCECYCLHCRRTFSSEGIWFQRYTGAPANDIQGHWLCPTPNCDGAGFTFDIFPVDPNHPANDGWSWDDDGEDDEAYSEDFVNFEDFDEAAEWEPEIESFDDPPGEYDPSESQYKRLDEQLGEAEDDIIEGDEWKLGLAPGEAVPQQVYGSESARREWEAEQKRFDGPDERPREVPWTPMDFGNDDIPF